MKMLAENISNSRTKTRHGTISGYDPSTYSVKVSIQPDGVLTGWIPLKSLWVGNGWGLFTPPSIGDAVEVDFQENDASLQSAGLRFFNDADRPLACPSGEFWVAHKTGSCIKFFNNGNVTISANKKLRLEGEDVVIHAKNSYKFDVNGQGQKWDGTGVETWQDDDIPKPHHDHSPPEI